MLFSAIHQHEPALSVHVSPLSWTSLPPPAPFHPVGCYRAPVWVPHVMQQIPVVCVFCISWCVCFHAAFSVCPVLLFPTPAVSTSLCSKDMDVFEILEQYVSSSKREYSIFFLLLFLLSEELQDALGVTDKSLPPFIYRMRQLGYPPGWLKEAELENSGLALYDGKGIVCSVR